MTDEIIERVTNIIETPGKPEILKNVFRQMLDRIVTSFHPELNTDTVVHTYFIEKIVKHYVHK